VAHPGCFITRMGHVANTVVWPRRGAAGVDHGGSVHRRRDNGRILCNLMQSYTMDGSCLTDYAASMKRRTIAVAILFPLGALALVRMMALMVWNQAPMGPIYALAQVQAGLYRNPQVWVGRTVRVRAQIDTLDGYGAGTAQTIPNRSSRYVNLLSMPAGSGMEIILGPPPSLHADPSTSYPAVSLFVGPRVSDPRLAALRHMPVIGRMVPAPDFESTPQNIWFPKVFVLRLLPRGQDVDALLLDVQ